MYYDAELDCWIFVAETDGILPDTVYGVITVDKDGNNIMLVNNKLSPMAKERTYLHERKHILKNHLFSLLPATEIERNM